MDEIYTVLPEASLTTLACVVLLVDVYRRSEATALTFWTAIFALLAVLLQLALGFPGDPTFAFNGTFVVRASGPRPIIQNLPGRPLGCFTSQLRFV